MKRRIRRAGLLTLLCLLLPVLAACGGGSAPEYPELAEIPEVETASQENSLIRLSYDPEKWIGQPMTDPMLFLYVETLGDAFSVNINVQYSGEFDRPLDEELMEELVQAIEQEHPADIETAQMYRVQDAPVICLESSTTITDELLDLMIAEGGWSEGWIESIGGRDVLLGESNRTITVYAVKEERLFIYTGSYVEERHAQPLQEALALAIATTEWVGP